MALLYVICVVLILVLLLVRFIVSNCDLVLQLMEMFGKHPESLEKKVVWITGSSSGIGEALAHRLAVAGCRIILSARREERLHKVKQRCLDISKCTSEDILILPLDLLDFNSHQQAVDMAIKYFKQIDVLVNNAGRSQRALWERTSLDVDRQMFEVNTLGPLSLTKALLPHMIQRKSGHIVVTSSIAGKFGTPGLGSYSGAKHALHGWFDCLRIEAFEHNINVTMVCPGPVFSEALLHAFTDSTEKMFNLGQRKTKWLPSGSLLSQTRKMKGTLGIEMKPDEKRMPASRCGHLIALAIANKLDEVWITGQPELFYTYLYQYFPYIAYSLGKRIGQKRVQKIKANFRNLH